MMFISALVIYFSFGLLGAEFAGVAYATVLLRDYGYMRRSKASWPFMRELINWGKVEHFNAELQEKLAISSKN